MKSLIKNAVLPIYHYLNSKYEREFLHLLDKYQHLPRHQEKNVRVLNYRFRVPDALSFVWQFKDIFVDEGYKFQSKNPPLIYDCGANIGMSCLYFKHFHPKAKIKAFEADPKIFKYLKDNLESNQLNDIEINNKAIWINNQEIDFASEGADAGSITNKGSRTIKIPAVRLKTLIDRENQSIDLLKIDIEGAESKVLLDCGESLKRVNNLFFEYHSWRNQPQDLDSILCLLTKNGFRYHITNQSYPFNPYHQNKMLELDMQLNIFAWRNR